MNTDEQIQNEYGWFYLLGQRLYGVSCILFPCCLQIFGENHPISIISGIVFLYFMFFGASRFTRRYRKIL